MRGVSDRAPARRRPPPFARTNVVAGLALVLLGAATFWLAAPLAGSQGPLLGPGSLPRAAAGILVFLGVVIAIAGWLRDDETMPRWRLRGPLFLLGAVLLFALLVRTVGLAVATPAAILVGGLASPETRPTEIVIFAVVLTAFCIGLFRYALGLPIPVAPWAGL
jgi:putative tricarboxylic transport membrane protein